MRILQKGSKESTSGGAKLRRRQVKYEKIERERRKFLLKVFYGKQWLGTTLTPLPKR